MRDKTEKGCRKMLSRGVEHVRIYKNGTKKKRKVGHAFKNKKRRRSQNDQMVLFSPMNRILEKLSGKVSFCALPWKRASLALETAFVLPLFLLGMITMISFMDIYQLQTQHLSKLCQTAKTSGMYAYGTSGNGPEELVLPDLYSYQPFGGLLPLRKVWTLNRVKVHTWTGKDFSDWNTGENDEIEEMVYVTESGGVYHINSGCTYLNLSVTKVSGSSVSSLRNSGGGKYHACEICSRNQSPAGTVYITRDGNRYHNHADCSGLKRTVRLVCKSDVDHMAVCSRCGKGNHSHS